MYANTVVSAPELKVNIKDALNFTESLKQHCTADKRAAVLLEVHTEALTAIIGDVRTPEQIERNARNLDRIKTMLEAHRQQRQVARQAQRPQVRLFRYGVTA